MIYYWLRLGLTCFPFRSFIAEPFMSALVAVTIFVNGFPFAAHVEVNA